MPAAKKKTTTPKTAAKPKSAPAKAKAAASASSAWGPEATQFFYDLTPERMLDAVEKFGVRCTGRLMHPLVQARDAITRRIQFAPNMTCRRKP